MDKQLRMRGRAFGGKLETLSVTVDDRGVVRVWDDVAGYYTTCHSLSERDQARARSAGDDVCDECAEHYQDDGICDHGKPLNSPHRRERRIGG